MTLNAFARYTVSYVFWAAAAGCELKRGVANRCSKLNLCAARRSFGVSAERTWAAAGAHRVACCGPIINYIISSMYDCIQSRESSSAASAAFLDVVATGSIRRSQRQQSSRVECARASPHTSHTYAHMSCGASVFLILEGRRMIKLSFTVGIDFSSRALWVSSMTKNLCDTLIIASRISEIQLTMAANKFHNEFMHCTCMRINFTPSKG